MHPDPLDGDVVALRNEYVATVGALRRRELATYDVSSRVRLTKTPEAYLAVRGERRELPYEALLANGRTSWTIGDRIRVYRTAAGSGGLVTDAEDGTRDAGARDPRDYDVEHYVAVLRENFAERLSRALTPEDFAAVVADPEQPSLFETTLAASTTVLTRQRLDSARAEAAVPGRS